MKFTLKIDPQREEEVVVYCHGESPLTDRLCELVEERKSGITAYSDGGIVLLPLGEVYAFTVEDGHVAAITERGRLRVRERIYQLEGMVGDDFVKINQSTLANLGHVDRFDVTIGGALAVIFKNGYRDYVSRRQLRAVKERIKERNGLNNE